MERKRYLQSLIKSISKNRNQEQILHLGQFAYDHKNHQTLIELNTIDILQAFLETAEGKLLEIILGALCNFSSNPQITNSLNFDLIISKWEKTSIHGQRSISCILFYSNFPSDGLESSDNAVNNILKIIQN